MTKNYDTEYTIVEPSFQLLDPPTRENELEFLELCTRNCYKSEDKIGPGTAEKLLSKVVKDLKHVSITEHANGIFSIPLPCEYKVDGYILDLINGNPLLASRISIDTPNNRLIFSGNLRMWLEFDSGDFSQEHSDFHDSIDQILSLRWPFFFDTKAVENFEKYFDISILDQNPVTNQDNLNTAQLRKHTVLTGRVICSRACSHQIVRHRKFVYSQESMRYCNYSKKGFQFIIPPSIREDKKQETLFINDCLDDYESYKEYEKSGIPPEDSRFVLPQATKTEIIMTATLNDWKHILEMRAFNKHAQWEIREIFLSAAKQLNQLLPEVFNAVT